MASPAALPGEMQALVLSEEQVVRFVTVPTPQLVHPGDAIVRVTACSVCGSDLHPYHGRERGIARDCVVGHEFVGEVVALGEQVKALQLGDRVASPFSSSCGDCFFCRKGATCRCCHSQAHLFGWVSEGEEQLPPQQRRGLPGSQAQFVRVPLAEGTLVKLPPDVSDEAGLLLGDILSTAFFAAERGEVGEGACAVVLGCGPVGLLAAMAARFLGAGQVFAVDSVPERLALAAELGATPLALAPPAAATTSAAGAAPPASSAAAPADSSAGADGAAAPEAAAAAAGTAGAAAEAEAAAAAARAGVVAAVLGATEGRGADCVLECVGSNGALGLAYELVRPMGTISSVGVNTSPAFPFSPVDAYNKNVTFRSGRCPARAIMTRLMPLVRDEPGSESGSGSSGSKLPWRRIFTHRMPLSKGPAAYDMFARRADGCVKIVLDPWA
ncbi:hypothetical protein HYH03_016389 [Edaphochlamys debaryana]|uniref:Alcohol dehydrogenase n=1 Tax=Edaphochlamys debaryana TaxID=47281 RepID=A0A835XKF3_9CHLO|nr:hypothetical protein HYH03_016389 [Edaphochlamys debaryana]|eukprot:KAG2484822.1 hypothetical protein HYH03_016389 [Edaphochlamys debaryana]